MIQHKQNKLFLLGSIRKEKKSINYRDLTLKAKYPYSVISKYYFQICKKPYKFIFEPRVANN